MSDELSPEVIDTLGEIGNIMMGAGATNLATLFNDRVDITAPEVFPGAVVETWPDSQALLVKVSMIGAVSGDSLFVLPTDNVRIIAEIMMAGMELSEEDVLGEMGLSAVGEAMNQLMAGSAIALSDVLGELVDITPPELTLVDTVDIPADDSKIRVRFDVRVGDQMEGKLSWLLDASFAHSLVDQVMQGMGGGSGQAAADRVAESAPVSAPAAAPEPAAGAPQPAPAPAAQPAPAAPPPPAAAPPMAPPVSVSPAAYPELGGAPHGVPVGDIALLVDVSMAVTVELGRTKLLVRDLLDLSEGSVVELDRPAGAPVDILVNGTLIARGDVVVVDDELGVRISEVLNPENRRAG